jgi:hypothetical protein
MAKSKVTVTEPNTVPAIQPNFELTPEEMQAVMEARKRTATPDTTGDVAAQTALAQALITAIESTRPPQKKTPFNRPKGSPWYSKDKPKLKRPMYQHGILLNPDQLSTEEVELLNKIKPGSYCDGFVRVIKRRDRSLDIDYPVRTAAQRLKLTNNYGVRSFAELLQRLITEAANPRQFKSDEDDDY